MSEQVQQVVAAPWRIPEWFKDLSSDQKNLLKKHFDEVVKHNKILSLISLKTVQFADAIHFADSILASRMILENSSISKIYDLGSGNGLPGVVMAILAPKIQVILVDKEPKKVEFLKGLIGTLGVKNVQVVHSAIENLPEGSVEVAMARDLGSIGKVLISTRKLFKKNGRLYHLKSEEWAVEVSEIPSQLCSHWGPSLIGDYKLPIGAAKFSIVKTEKLTD
ncbi:MAG: 16S rRNA (guanine(527)-N(7))-methyltransferase RsmG [Pseudobdellovibrionaceae bacterium]